MALCVDITIPQNRPTLYGISYSGGQGNNPALKSRVIAGIPSNDLSFGDRPFIVV